jgi:hypothetical protein
MSMFSINLACLKMPACLKKTRRDSSDLRTAGDRWERGVERDVTIMISNQPDEP